MSEDLGRDGADPTRSGTADRPNPMEAIAFQRRMIGWLLAALALIVATFFVSNWRPLFGGSGFGLVIELVSLSAGIALAAAATVSNLGHLLGHHLGIHGRVVAVVVSAVVAVAVALDLVAVAVVIFRR